MNDDQEIMVLLLKETILKLLKHLTPKLYKFRFDESNTVLQRIQDYQSRCSLLEIVIYQD